MTCNNEGMSSNDPESQNPTRPNPAQGAQRQLMLGTRGYETTVFVGSLASPFSWQAARLRPGQATTGGSN